MAATVSQGDLPEELKSPVIVKKLGIIDYAQYGSIADVTTINGFDKGVKKAPGPSSAPPSTNSSSPSRRLVQVFDKKAVPTLDTFSGRDEDYFTLKESTINLLGTAGFGLFLSEAIMVIKHPDVAESVSYELREAVHGGPAQLIAHGMLDDTTLDPAAVWTRLEEFYDTALIRANVVLFDIRRLPNLRDCLRRLRKNNTRLPEDSDTPRALLRVSIQDDGFEMVRDSIVHSKPTSSVDMVLTEICKQRETSLMMKDQASSLGGDGSMMSYSWRTAQTSSSKLFSKNGGGQKLSTTDQKKWNLPNSPTLGNGLSVDHIQATSRMESRRP